MRLRENSHAIPRLLLCALALATLAQVEVAQAASASLYDSTSARRPGASERALLGPQSGKYRYDKRMILAARIAHSRAHARSTAKCWRYVKTALLAANVIGSYPRTNYAKQAGEELTRSYGFKKLRLRNPYDAPVGSVLVYGGRGAGHVEIRTTYGFVSDYASRWPAGLPLLGIYVKG